MWRKRSYTEIIFDFLKYYVLIGLIIFSPVLVVVFDEAFTAFLRDFLRIDEAMEYDTLTFIDVLLNIFITGGLILSAIVFLLARKNIKDIKAHYEKYRSEVAAKDYYIEPKRIDYIQVIRAYMGKGRF